MKYTKATVALTPEHIKELHMSPEDASAINNQPCWVLRGKCLTQAFVVDGHNETIAAIDIPAVCFNYSADAFDSYFDVPPAEQSQYACEDCYISDKEEEEEEHSPEAIKNILMEMMNILDKLSGLKH